MSSKPNQYKNFNGKIYPAQALEVFMHPGLNGQEQWHVSGVESDSYCCYQGCPGSESSLLKAAEKVIRSKYEFIGDIKFLVRPISESFRGNGNYEPR